MGAFLTEERKFASGLSVPTHIGFVIGEENLDCKQAPEPAIVAKPPGSLESISKLTAQRLN